MKKKKHYIRSTVLLLSVAMYCGLCGCYVPIGKKDDTTVNEPTSAVTPTADRSVLTERQKAILAENGLPTDIDKLESNQKRGIMNIENAFLYLDEKYKGVEFECLSHDSAWIMGQEKTAFVPKGYDKEDSRNIVTVEKDRDGNYSDKYILVAVREAMEKVVTDYVEAYFGEGNVKVYVYPCSADMEYDDVINENTVKDKVESTAVLFVPDEECTEAQLDAFSDTYLNDGHDFVCNFRATIIRKEDFDRLTYKNHSDMYDRDHMIYDIDINMK
ncbi:MAG: hypothetical protein K6G33_05955 [Ruminococcus sp.]|uniref:hypothetical protein n=1 Tax=Ruminococcus sp. TaxID=41978 RepID=UPI0025FF8F7C|nr:hypothetical protein [Ruminococcus sp.]MCR5600266.1 hypothetical protein [Ruminococcus sp.]